MKLSSPSRSLKWLAVATAAAGLAIPAAATAYPVPVDPSDPGLAAVDGKRWMAEHRSKAARHRSVSKPAKPCKSKTNRLACPTQ